jgi:hypothetical protein
MLKLGLSSLFGSRVSSKLTRASSLTKRAKIVERLVKKLINPSRVEPSYERVEPAHEFLAHDPALAPIVDACRETASDQCTMKNGVQSVARLGVVRKL